MTDETDLTPEREAAVRRLLGSVGADAPALPADVAERLDAALGDLVAERSTAPAEHLAPVVPLSSRRRKTFAALFVAAAAVVVAGIGVPLLHDDSPERPTASSEAALNRTPSVGAGAVPNRPQLDSSRHTTNDYVTGLKGPHAPSARSEADGIALGRRTLRADLIRLRREVPPGATFRSTTLHAPAAFTCRPADFGRGYLLGERYAGAPVVVAFRRPAGSTQVAEVLQCGTGTVLRSITLPIH